MSLNCLNMHEAHGEQAPNQSKVQQFFFKILNIIIINIYLHYIYMMNKMNCWYQIKGFSYLIIF